MKIKITIILFVALAINSNAQVKSRIANFSMNGYVRGMTLTDNKQEPDLQFIGSTSARMGDSLLSDMMLTFTEQELGKFLGHELIPVTRERGKHVPDYMNGSLIIMETVTEKKAFKEMGLDEIVTLNCQLNYNSMKTVKGTRMYVPVITLNLKVIGKDGKTIFKKNETLKMKEKTVSGELIEEKQENGTFDISLKNLKTLTVDTGDKGELKGVSSVELLDWYKQVLGNALIKD
jgi:hypothetical protein